MKIKEIKIVNQDGSTELADIGADAVNVDYNDTTVKAELDKLNNNVDTNTTNISSEIATRANAITNLQSQVSSLASGGPAGVYATVAALTTADPDHNKTYIVSADGHWYYYNNGWQDGGTYQAVEINKHSLDGSEFVDNIITNKKLKSFTSISDYQQTNLLENVEWLKNKRYSGGTWYDSVDFYTTAEPIPVIPGEDIFCNGYAGLYLDLSEMDENQAYLRTRRIGHSNEYNINDDAYYIYFSYKKANNPQEYEELIRSSENTQLGDKTDKNNSLLIDTNNIKAHTITPRDIFGSQDVVWKDLLKYVKWYEDKRWYNGYLVFSKNFIASDFILINKDFINCSKAISIPGSRIAIYDENYNMIQQSNDIHSFTPAYDESKYMTVSLPKSELPNFSITMNSGVEKITLPWLSIDAPEPVYTQHKGIVFGDSLWSNCKGRFNYTTTPYHTSTDLCYGYQQYLAEKNIILTNKAVSGSTISSCWTSSGIQELTAADLADIEFIIFAFGRNDSRGAMALGEIGNASDTTGFNTSTLFGAYRQCIQFLLNLKPTLKIVLWTMTQTDANGWGVDSTNSRGLKQIDYVNAVKQVAALYAAPVVDLYNNININTQTLPEWTFEGVHLTNEGYAFAKNYYVNKMMEILNS